MLYISLALEAATKDTKQLQAATSATPDNPVPVYKMWEGENLHQALSATLGSPDLD